MKYTLTYVHDLQKKKHEWSNIHFLNIFLLSTLKKILFVITKTAFDPKDQHPMDIVSDQNKKNDLGIFVPDVIDQSIVLSFQ